MILHPLEATGRSRAILRWTSAGLCVVAAHVGLGWWGLGHPPPRAAPPEAAQGIIVDLEPVAPPQTARTTLDTAPSDAASPLGSDAMPPPPDPPPPESQPPGPQPPEPPAAEPVAPPPQASPPAESRSDALVAPPPPPKPNLSRKPKPVPPKPQPQPRRPTPRRPAHEAAEPAVAEAGRSERKAAREQARQRGGRTERMAPASSVSSGAAVGTWRGEVRAHLDAYGSASPNGASGTVRVAFSVDRNGRVLSVGVVGSSGDSMLDAAAVALVRRASPVPAPPPELGGRVGIVAPVRFE